MDIIKDSLALFQPPYIEKNIQTEYWVDYNPMATISEQSVIEFNNSRNLNGLYRLNKK